jgi:dTDP-4-amino-4,6-dideoxygalactose transaminase
MSIMPEELIGGLFALADPSSRGTSPPFASDKAISFINARSAMAFALRELGCRRAWLPSYICGALADVAPEIRYYALDRQLRLADDFTKLEPGDAVIIVHHFGFRADPTIAVAARARGARIVEDAAQAAFLMRNDSDCIVYSPRKWVGVPDGGVLLWNDVRPVPALEPPPQTWWLNAFEASLRRRDFDRGSNDRAWFSRFQESEMISPQGDFRMSDIATALLARAFDWDAIRHRRCANYAALLDRLGDLALLPILGDVVPLGFPIRVGNRPALVERLHARNIFPPVHWPLPHVPTTFAQSHALSAELLTLPCDQRYDEDDMQRMADLLATVMA